MTCDQSCEKYGLSCDQVECRNYIEYEEDLNCVLVCVRKHGTLTLEEVSKRMGVSYVRIKQIEDRALKKIKSNVTEDECDF
jgi:hypothetical protein